MAGVLAIAVIVFLAAGFVGTRYLTRVAPATPGRTGETQLAPPPGGLATRALVRRLEQEGMSRGHSSHRCRLDLLVVGSGAAGVRPVSCVADLATTSLPWFAPGCVVDVVVDPLDDAIVVPSIDATRRRATGLERLPEVGCGRVPDQVYLHDDERDIVDALEREAVVGCIDIDTAEHSTRDMTTIGLWVLDPDAPPGSSPGAGRAVVVSEPLLLVQILEIPLGATVPVRVDPKDPTRVVIDYRSARNRLLARHSPSRLALDAAAASAGRDGDGTVLSLASITSLAMTGSQHGIRRGCRLTLEPQPDPRGAPGGATEPPVVELSVAVPGLVLLIPGSIVVFRPDRDRGGHPLIDLAATAEIRARAGAIDAGWAPELPPFVETT